MLLNILIILVILFLTYLFVSVFVKNFKPLIKVIAMLAYMFVLVIAILLILNFAFDIQVLNLFELVNLN